MALLRWLRWAWEGFVRVIAPPLAVVLPWVGGLLLVVAGGFGVHSWRFAGARVRATATVTENVSGFAKEGGVLYYPRLRFRAANGELVMVLSKSGSDEIEFAAGDTVPVLYQAGDTQSATIATAWRAYQGAIVMGLLGTALFDLGWVLRVVLRRRLA